MPDLILTTPAVSTLIQDCLAWHLTDEEDQLAVKGVANDFVFDAASIKHHRAQIERFLGELPEEFMDDADQDEPTWESAGWTFANACTDRHDRPWADAHLLMDALFCLGIAAGVVKWTYDREKWDELPGGMPYVLVLRSKFGEPQP